MKLNYKNAKSTFLILLITIFASLFISYSADLINNDVSSPTTEPSTTSILDEIVLKIEPTSEDILIIDNCHWDFDPRINEIKTEVDIHNNKYAGNTYRHVYENYQISPTQLDQKINDSKLAIDGLVIDCKGNPKPKIEPIFVDDKLRNLPSGDGAPEGCDSFHGKLILVDNFNQDIRDPFRTQTQHIELESGRTNLLNEFHNYKNLCIDNINTQQSSDTTTNSDTTTKSDTTTNSDTTTKSDTTTNSDTTIKTDSTTNSDTTTKSDTSTEQDSTSNTVNSNEVKTESQIERIPPVNLVDYNIPSDCNLPIQLKTDIQSWNNNLAGKDFNSYNQTQQEHIKSFRNKIENRINFRIDECKTQPINNEDSTLISQTDESETTTNTVNNDEEFFVPNIKMDYTCFELVEAKQNVDDFYHEHKDLDFYNLPIENQTRLRHEKEILWNNLYEQKRLCDLKKDIVQKYYTYEIKNEIEEEFVTDESGNEKFNDTYEYRKFSYNQEDNTVIFKDVNGDEKQISIQNHTKRRIISYINGEEHEQIIEPKDVAMLSHRIKRFRDVDNAQQFLEKVDEMNQKIEIKKDITYNKDTGKSKVKIDVKSKVDQSLKDVSIYLVVPKEVALSANEINIANDGGGTRFIVEKDPVIGWYFNDSESVGEIEYEVNGESEGGTIIVSQEPKLYNGPNLIINYRETNCNNDEAYLFDIDDLSDSKVYQKDSGKLYKVCVAHIDYILNNDLSESSFELLSFDNLGYVSFTSSFDNQVYLSTQSNDNVEWEVQISKTRPSNLYSCIGSINDDSNSLFGDCEYSENKIWIALNKEEIIEDVNLSGQVQEEKEKTDYILLMQEVAMSKLFFFGFLLFIFIISYFMYKRISNKVV